MKNKLHLLSLVFLIGLSMSTAKALSTATVGETGSGATYATLQLAVAKIIDGTLTGDVELQLVGNTLETDLSSIPASGTGSANYTSVTIYPSGAARTITSGLGSSIITIAGSNVTINGRINKTDASGLTITNTNTVSASAHTILILAPATATPLSNVRVEYCTINALTASITRGNLYINFALTPTVAIGNIYINNNTFTGRSANAIISKGVSLALPTSGLNISNNKFENCLSQTLASNVINIDANHITATISGNSIYDTGYSPSTIGSAVGINVLGGYGHTISGNYIGGATHQSGTLTKGGTTNGTFAGINLATIAGAASSIQGNTIAGISWVSSTNNFKGIAVSGAGDVNVGTVTGNTIGDASTGSITFTSSGAGATTLTGIDLSTTGATDVQQNVIGSITTNHTNVAGIAAHFVGISKTAVAGTTTLSNNIIGSTTVSGSITCSKVIASQNSTGISCAGTGTNTISNNTIANILNYTTTGINYGINCTGGTSTINANLIHSLQLTTANSTTAALQGITTSSILPVTIFNNIIKLGDNAVEQIAGITNTSACTAVNVYHNTVYLTGTATGGATQRSACFYNNMGSLTGKTLYVRNNIFSTERLYAGSPTGTNVNAALGSVATTNATSANFTWDSNDLYSTTPATIGVAALVGKTLAQWKAITWTGYTAGYTYDPNSLNTDPAFADKTGTTALNFKQTVLLTGATGTGITTDYASTTRATIPSMGAYELLTNVTISGSTGANGGYGTLKAAFDAINANATQTGNNIVISLNANTTETAAAVLNENATWTSVKIYPTTTGLSITGDLATPLIDLNGADNVTIDGRVNATGSTKSLIITNTSTSATAGTSTLRMYNGANSNTVKYCTVKGSSMATADGVIRLAATSGFAGYATANTANIIDNNNITNSADANRPRNAIYSDGAANTVTISNNNIYDFLNRTILSYGVNLNAGTAASSITGNSFYETASFVATTNAQNFYAINCNTAEVAAIGITGNYIGGNAANVSGTWMKTGTYNVFIAIKIAGSGPTYTVQSNTISNFNWTNTDFDNWIGIYAVDGSATIGGSGLGNTISNITLTNTTNGGTFTGISLAGSNSLSCNYNLIQAITCANTATNSTDFIGINIANTATGTQVNYNTIGHATNANSIIATSVSSGNSQIVIGIHNTAASTGLTISNNNIANLTNSTTNVSPTAGGLYGILNASNATIAINSNTIHHLSSSNINNNFVSNSGIAFNFANTSLTSVTNNIIYNLNDSYSSTVGGSLVGIIFNAGSGVNNCSGNSIYNLSATGTNTATTFIYGLIFKAGNGANTVNDNFIYGLSAPSSTTVEIDGIEKTSGVATLSNNIINLGTTDPASIYGISDISSANTTNLYFNTVYIGGTVASGAYESTALYIGSNGNTLDVRNNIFVNARSNSGAATSKHYAVDYYTPIVINSNYNDYFVTGTGGVLALYDDVEKPSLADIKTAMGVDANSYSINPGFTNGGSTTAADYQISKDLAGASGTGLTTDYGLVSRATIPTIGAWEKSGMVNRWRGVSGTDWNTAANWTLNSLPAADADLIFDYEPLNNCALEADHSVTNITNASSNNLVTNGHKLTIKGAISQTSTGKIDASSASSTLEFAGSSAQAIPTSSFYNNQVYNLTINNADNVTLNGTLNLLNTLTATTGRLDASTASPTVVYGGTTAQSIINTAFISDKVYNLTSDNAAGVTLNSDFGVDNALTIANGCNLTVSAGKNLSVAGTLTNNAGASGLVIKSSASGNGSLMHNTAGVAATVQSYMLRNGWNLISSPVSGQSLSAFVAPVVSDIAVSSPYYGFRSYDESLNQWNAYVTTSTLAGFGNLEVGSGYAARRAKLVNAAYPSQDYATYTGTLASGAITPTVVRSATNRGFNCLGNPYAAPLAINANADATNNFISVNAASLDPSYTAIYAWVDTVQYKTITNATAANYVPVGSGFFIRAKTAFSTPFQFTAAMRKVQSDIAFRGVSTTWTGFDLVATTTSGPLNTSIKLNSQMTDGLDITYDGGLMRVNNNYALYTRLVNDNGVDFSVQCLTDTLIHKIIPVGFDYSMGGATTFSAPELTMPEGVVASLEDRTTGLFTDFNSPSSNYQVTLPVNTAGIGRFFIHLIQKLPTDVNAPLSTSNITVNASISGITILGAVGANAKAKIYNGNGVMEGIYALKNSSQNSISSTHLKSGFYILVVESDKGKVAKKFRL